MGLSTSLVGSWEPALKDILKSQPQSEVIGSRYVHCGWQRSVGDMKSAEIPPSLPRTSFSWASALGIFAAKLFLEHSQLKPWPKCSIALLPRWLVQHAQNGVRRRPALGGAYKQSRPSFDEDDSFNPGYNRATRPRPSPRRWDPTSTEIGGGRKPRKENLLGDPEQKGFLKFMKALLMLCITRRCIVGVELLYIKLFSLICLAIWLHSGCKQMEVTCEPVGD